eukprot:Rmarinus@m.27385
MSETLCVQGVPVTLSDTGVRDFFRRFGAIGTEVIRHDGRKWLSVLVRFSSSTAAETARVQIQGSRLFQSTLTATNAEKVIVSSDVDVGTPGTTVPPPGLVTAKTQRITNDSANDSAYESVCPELSIANPRPRHLCYLYPPPTAATLVNIMNTMIAVPKFYTQVLHLMNKMNLPPPFSKSDVTATPPIRAVWKSYPPPHPHSPPRAKSNHATKRQPHPRGVKTLANAAFEGCAGSPGNGGNGTVGVVGTSEDASTKRPDDVDSGSLSSGESELISEESESESAPSHKRRRVSATVGSARALGNTRIIAKSTTRLMTAKPVLAAPPKTQDAKADVPSNATSQLINIRLRSPLKPKQQHNSTMSGSSTHVRKPTEETPLHVNNDEGAGETVLSQLVTNTSTSSHTTRLPLRSLQLLSDSDVEQHAPPPLPPSPPHGGTHDDDDVGYLDIIPEPRKPKYRMTKASANEVEENTQAMLTPGLSLPCAISSGEYEDYTSDRFVVGEVVAEKNTSAASVSQAGDVQEVEVTQESIISGKASDSDLQQIAMFTKYKQGEPSPRLFVKNLHKSVTQIELRPLFDASFPGDTPKGDVDIQIMSGRMKGQAFVSMPSIDLAKAALSLLHGYRLKGKPMYVAFAKSD